MKIWTAICELEFAEVAHEVFNNRADADKFMADCLRLQADVEPEAREAITPENWQHQVNEVLCLTGHMEIREVDIHEPETTGLDAIIAENVPDQSDGDLEVDFNAVVSLGEDPGAYVSCWKWVSFAAMEQPMAIIEEDGTVWYFDDFEEFMDVWCEAPNCRWEKGTPELLEQSGGPSMADDFFAARAPL